MALCWCARPAAGSVSSGGNYSMESSVLLPGSQLTDSGATPYSVISVIGEYNLPTTNFFDEIDGGPFNLRLGFLNPPRFSLQNFVPQLLADSSGSILLTLPAYSVPISNFDVLFISDPEHNSAHTDLQAIINSANHKMEVNRGAFAKPLDSNIWEIDVENADGGSYSGPISPNGSITINFTVTGDIVTDHGVATNPPVKASTLQLWLLDEEHSLWVRVPDFQLDLLNHRITAPLSHLSVYALIGGADTNVDNVFAYPVPFRPNGPNAGTGPGQTGTEAGGITFTSLPSEGTIEIYTLSGQRVRTLDIPAQPKIVWDVKNSAGESVASGVYIWRLKAGDNSKTGRLMVIR